MFLAFIPKIPYFSEKIALFLALLFGTCRPECLQSVTEIRDKASKTPFTISQSGSPFTGNRIYTTLSV